VVHGSPRTPAENGDTVVIANREGGNVLELPRKKLSLATPYHCDIDISDVMDDLSYPSQKCRVGVRNQAIY